MGIKLKSGKFEATVPALHTLPVSEVMLIMKADNDSQAFHIGQSLMRRLTWAQKKKFESLTMEQFADVISQWVGAEKVSK